LTITRRIFDIRDGDQQVIVVVHQPVSVTAPALLVDFVAEQFQKPAAIAVINKIDGWRKGGV